MYNWMLLLLAHWVTNLFLTKLNVCLLKLSADYPNELILIGGDFSSRVCNEKQIDSVDMYDNSNVFIKERII